MTKTTAPPAIHANGATAARVDALVEAAIVKPQEPRTTPEKAKARSDTTWTDYVDAAQQEGYSFALNELDDRVEVNGKRMSDVVEAELLSLLHARGLRNADVARRAFTTAAAQNRYHPVKRFFEAQRWDCKDHIAQLAEHFTDAHPPILYADGTQRTVIHAWLRRWLVGAVAKVHDPISAQNPMLILDGAQGAGKSHFAKWICPLPDLQFEGAIRPEDKDYLGYLTTRWIWEVSELGATMRKADQEALKAFITLQEATYRPAYGRHPLHKPALASFIGTVNFDGALLSDQTGHRRFHPVELAAIDWGYSQAVDVDQLWAQAYALYRQGEPWQLTSEEREAHRMLCEQYAVEDVLAIYVVEWFDIELVSEWFTPTSQIIDHLKTFAGLREGERRLAMQLGATLTRLGLRKGQPGALRGWYGIRPRETRRTT